MSVLSPNDLAFFKANGYVVVRQAVPINQCQAVIDTMFAFLEMNPNEPDDWYRLPLTPGGMLELYQHQTLWNNRQTPKIHAAFADIFANEKLWVSFDRVNFKPPRRADHPEYDHKGFIHWDADTSKPVPFGVQGVLYLTDTTEAMGGFQCIPELYRDFDEWVKTQPVSRNPRAPDYTGYPVTPIPGKAGDLVIWNRMLPHGNGHNVSDAPRFAQFITMYPALEDSETVREDRIHRWHDRLPPQAEWAPGDLRRWEETNATTAELTPLGRRLLGLDSWA